MKKFGDANEERAYENEEDDGEEKNNCNEDSDERGDVAVED